MMPYDGSKISTLLVAKRRRATRIVFTMAIVFALTSLGCGLISRSESDQIVMPTRLPILTRTPLPTLTPTPLLSTPPAVSDITSGSVLATQPPTASLIPTAMPGEAESTSAPASPTAVATLLPTPTPGKVEPSVVPSTPTDLPSPTSTATSTPLPTATPTPLPTDTATPETGGWSFTNVRTHAGEYGEGLWLYGDLINETGTTQHLMAITGTFYDSQGQLIADQNNTADYWPLDVVPAGGRIPFELNVEGIQALANFELWADSEASENPPRQDFSFTEVGEWTEDDVYCLEGGLVNPGNALKEYLVIVAVFYDAQGKVINFSEDYAADPSWIVADEIYDFVICLDPPGKDARHELQAWGL